MDLRNFRGSLLITGVTGFIGGALVRGLLAEGLPTARLRCLVRDRTRAADHTDVPAECLCEGDLDDAGSLSSIVRGVDTTVHLAGATRALNADGFDRANRAGTAHLTAALELHAPGSRLVHVSSLAAVGPSVDGQGTDRPPEHCMPVSAYGESKRRGELAVQAARALRRLILRPPIVYGPEDAATRLLVAQATAPLVFVPRHPRPLSIVHVDDVCEVIRRCAFGTWPDGADGACVPLDGPDRTDTDRLMVDLASAFGRRGRLVRVPDSLLRGAACVADSWSALRRRAQFFSRDKVHEITAAGWVADPRPLSELFGARARTPLHAGLAQLARTMRP